MPSPLTELERSPTGTVPEAGRVYRLAPRPGRRWSPHLVAALSWLNLAGVIAVVVLLCFVSERWWLSGVLTYLPRIPYAVPAAVLLGMSLWTARRVWWVNAVSLLLAIGPIMGLSIPVETPPPPASGRTPLRIVSCNVREGSIDPHRLIQELRQFRPDVVALQETARGFEPFQLEFADWHVIRLREFFIASKHPARVVEHCRAAAFDRWTALLVEIETPDGPILLSNAHLATPRHGATGLTPYSLITGDGVDEFDLHQWLRSEEAAATRAFLDARHTRPLIVVGDFNTPTTSSLFSDHWHGLQSAFEAAGWGYGYTAPCNTDTVWPQNTPWVRIDHILADDAWRVHACEIGRRDASDHRLIFAELSLIAPSGPSAP